MISRIAVLGRTGFLGQIVSNMDHPQADLIPIDRTVADLTRSFELHLGDVLKRHMVDTALICAAISSPDECKLQPELSDRVNVDGTIRLFKLLHNLKIKPVFFSTDHVYDGQKGHYNESDLYAPVTLYGEQKVKTETFLREHFDDFLIIRTSKQISMGLQRKNILAENILKLLRGQNIRAATDHKIAPTFAEDIARITIEAVLKGLSGPLHVAAQSLTRYEFGLKIVKAMGLDPSRVEACSIHDFNFVEKRPPQCTLDSSLLQKLLNPTFTPIEMGVAKIVEKCRRPDVAFEASLQL